MSAAARLTSALADRYRVERELGAGGMATVYLAHDLKHERDVAIKVLHEDLGAALGAERFLAEIKTTAKLQHPHILPLLDSGDAGGLLFYVMPYVAGESLRDRLTREKQLPIEDAVRIAREVADALAHAHGHGVIHRDIKPENILLQDGHALVADFGIALAVQSAGSQRMTQTGLSLGTPQYMSPEQAMGEKSVDARADIYALGAVTYEILTGEPPFTGATVQAIVARVMSEEPRPIASVRKTVPGNVEAAVLKALAKLPADRWAGAAKFGSAITASVPTAVPSEPIRLRRSRLALVGATVAIAAVLAALAWLLRDRGAPPVLGLRTAVTTDAALELEPALSPDGRFVAYTVGPVGNSRIFVQQVPRGRPTRVTDDERGAERFPLWSPDGTQLAFRRDGRLWVTPAHGGTPQRLLPREDSATGTMSWSNTRGRVAFIRPGRGIVVADLTGGSQAQVYAHPYLSSPAWAPDDRWIAVMAGNEGYNSIPRGIANLAPSAIWLIRPDGSSAHPITDSTSLHALPVWGPDAQSIFFVSNREGPRDLYYLSLDRQGKPRGAPQRLTTGANPHSVSLTRDGGSLVYSQYQPRSAIWRVPIPVGGEATMTQAERVTFANELVEAMNVSRDGKWIYYDAERDGRADLFRVQIGSRVAEQLTNDPADDFAPDPSPDGREIVFMSFRNGNRDLFLMNAGGGGAEPLVIGPSSDNYPTWSPDGKRIAFIRDGAFAWISREADGTWTPPVLARFDDREVGIPRWTPDGDLIASPGRAIVRIHVPSGSIDTLYRATAAGDPLPARATPSRDGRMIYFKSYRDGVASFWSIPATGGKPRRVLQLDSTQPSDRVDWATDGRHLYFAINNVQSDVWLVHVTRP